MTLEPSAAPPDDDARARRLANLGPPRPENMVPANRTEHGAWTLFRHGVLPDVPAAPELVAALDGEQAKLEAACGGWAAMTTEARTLVAQWRTAAGCRALIEAWAGGRPTLLSPKQGRLPRAVSADWHRFATLERTLLRELREHFTEKRVPSVDEYFAAKRAAAHGAPGGSESC